LKRPLANTGQPQNRYYDPGLARAEKVNSLFSRIARRYDLVNDLQSLGLHRLWKNSVAKMAVSHTGCQVLDVCCGSGDIAFRMQKLGAQVTAVDFNAPMLEVAEQRSRCTDETAGAKADVPIQFMRGDAMNLPFLAHSFDSVTIGYGLRNLSDWRAGVREMLRVLKPGGKLVILDCGKPENPILRALFYGYLKTIVPLLGLVFSGDSQAYAYLLVSLQHFPGAKGIAADLKRAGMTDITIKTPGLGAMSLVAARKGEMHGNSKLT
jgi:demethylmenaquinone methyltransferase/2-methoxy-6-polyprenyl-1,4-benzoquinol methylase